MGAKWSLHSGKSALNSPMKLSRRNKKELREIMEIIAPVVKNWLIGPLLFFLILGEMFLVMGWK